MCARIAAYFGMIRKAGEDDIYQKYAFRIGAAKTLPRIDLVEAMVREIAEERDAVLRAFRAKTESDEKDHVACAMAQLGGPSTRGLSRSAPSVASSRVEMWRKWFTIAAIGVVARSKRAAPTRPTQPHRRAFDPRQIL